MSAAKEPDLVQTHQLCDELAVENERLAARLRTYEVPLQLRASEEPSSEPVRGPVRQVPRAAVANALEALEHNEAKPKTSRVSVPVPQRPSASSIEPRPLMPVTRPQFHDPSSLYSQWPKDERASHDASLAQTSIHPAWLLWFFAAFVIGSVMGMLFP
jgi:hypothetical protein